MDINTASREIMWNVSHVSNTIIMYALLLLSLIIGFNGVFRQFELWKSGKPAPEHTGNYLQRFKDIFLWGFLQHGVVKEKSIAVAHTLVYIGFLALLFTTTMVFIDHDLGLLWDGFKIYDGKFYLGVTIMSDVLGLGLILGCAMIAKRRYFDLTDKLHNRVADYFFLITLVLLCVQGFLIEGLRIHATNDPWAAYSPVGFLVAKFFWFLSEPATRWVHFGLWWFHTITVFIVIAITPYTKFFHIIASSVNLYFRSNQRPKGSLKNIGDLQKLMEEATDDFNLGTDTIKDYNWKQLMDLDACTSCGRCQDVCPAYSSGKPLSPKWLILDTRNHALALNANDQLAPSLVPKFFRNIDKFLTTEFFLKSSGVREAEGKLVASGDYRGANVAVQSSLWSLGQSADQSISGSVMDPNVFWSCTTCYACVTACPVGINHVDQIMSNRRNMVMMKGEIPSEAQASLRMLESQGNPYGAAEDRSKWYNDLDLPIVKAGDEVDYLYWVGCVSAFDPRKQKIARSLVKIMQTAGLSFGILGNAEGCTGDPARRLGDENLFQTLAKSNIETLKSVKFKNIVANCPHCFNTIKNEYPQFGNLGEGREPNIIHHSKLIKQLLAEEKIKLDPNATSYTFHDPCYLGRYNDEYDAPREVVAKSSKLKVLEMEQSREKGKCCGAGGGHFWMDLKQGERINVQRVNQAEATGAEKIATGCPFCLQMMEDGVKINSSKMEVQDLAEIIAERLIIVNP